MNFLAHAMLSFDDNQILSGNMFADFVKGLKALEQFPKGIKTGILLHRKIDEYTDHHPATLKAKNIFRPQYRLYSGAFVDIVFDHFLANDPRYFPDLKELKRQTEHIYAEVYKNEAYFPEKFSYLFKIMSQENWLYEYHNFKGLKQGLAGITRRAKYLDEWQIGFELCMRHYYELNQLYFDLIDDIVVYTKKELIQLT